MKFVTADDRMVFVEQPQVFHDEVADFLQG
jgi:hypothetical protein